jgi:hypothetical protein
LNLVKKPDIGRRYQQGIKMPNAINIDRDVMR